MENGLRYARGPVLKPSVTFMNDPLRGSVLDCPNGFGALLAHTLIPCTLWMLVSKVGVKDRPFKL